MAITHARSGLARSGLTRSGFAIQNVIVLVDDVDITASVQPESMRLTLAINDEPDTAEFTIPAWTGLVTVPGQTVRIGLGDTTTNPIFGGQIISQEHQFEPDGQETPWVTVFCVDWGKLFNRGLVVDHFGGMTISEAVVYIVENHTDGFTALRVDPALTAILPDDYVAINEPPLTVLQKLATLVKGGFAITADRDLALWGEGGRADAYAQTPETLVGGLWSLRKFRHTLDTAQWRTRAVVEGRSAKLPTTIPAGGSADLPGRGIPVDHDGQWFFHTAVDAGGSNWVRIGSLRVSYQVVQNVIGPPSVVTAANALPGDTSLALVPGGGTGLTGTTPFWVYEGAAGDAYFMGTNVIANTLVGIPASGYGALTIPIPAGTVLYQTGRLTVISSNANRMDINTGTEIVVRAEVNDLAAQAVIAAAEDSDGVHTIFVSDPSLTWEGCKTRAEAELALFNATLPSATWETVDLNALPGATQAVAFTEADGLTATLVIQNVTFTFHSPVLLGTIEQQVSASLPTRACEGGLVKLQSFTGSN